MMFLKENWRAMFVICVIIAIAGVIYWYAQQDIEGDNNSGSDSQCEKTTTEDGINIRYEDERLIIIEKK